MMKLLRSRAFQILMVIAFIIALGLSLCSIVEVYEFLGVTL